MAGQGGNHGGRRAGAWTALEKDPAADRPHHEPPLIRSFVFRRDITLGGDVYLWQQLWRDSGMGFVAAAGIDAVDVCFSLADAPAGGLAAAAQADEPAHPGDQRCQQHDGEAHERQTDADRLEVGRARAPSDLVLAPCFEPADVTD